LFRRHFKRVGDDYAIGFLVAPLGQFLRMLCQPSAEVELMLESSEIGIGFVIL
jgi:hypothetical protein